MPAPRTRRPQCAAEPASFAFRARQGRRDAAVGCRPGHPRGRGNRRRAQDAAAERRRAPGGRAGDARDPGQEHRDDAHRQRPGARQRAGGAHPPAAHAADADAARGGCDQSPGQQGRAASLSHPLRPGDEFQGTGHGIACAVPRDRGPGIPGPRRRHARAARAQGRRQRGCQLRFAQRPADEPVPGTPRPCRARRSRRDARLEPAVHRLRRAAPDQRRTRHACRR